jgi:hypothetical protein
VKTIKLEVTDRGAIYVNNIRITDRSTKWGLHTIIFSTMCERDKVLDTLVANGYNTNRIDDPTYMKV